MPTPRHVLSLLSVDEVRTLAGHLGVPISAEAELAPLLDGLASQAGLADALATLDRKRLKELCATLGLDTGGKEKLGIASRLLDQNRSAQEAQSTASRPPAAEQPSQRALRGDSSRSDALPRAGQLGLPMNAAEPPAVAPAAPAAAPASASALTPRSFKTFSEVSGFIWQIADLLRGEYKAHDYGKVILPMTVLRRLDCVLEPTKKAVLEQHEKNRGRDPELLRLRLESASRLPFFNTSPQDFKRLLGDAEHLADNLDSYIKGFSKNAYDILDKFDFLKQIPKLAEAGILFKLVAKYGEVPLDDVAVPNHVMGSIFEDLIRRFGEQSNETAGEHFTPREVVRLMVDLLFAPDRERLLKPGIAPTLFDPACGTGGMLSVAEERLREWNQAARLQVYGQELNDESYAICKADMMLKGQNADHITLGNSLAKGKDGHSGERFDYMLSNPPFGVDWKKVQKDVEDEHEQLGYSGRFGAGLPRINDGSFLFLQHMLGKAKHPQDGGSRLAIVFNGSPLFTGDAGSGESNIRQWILENDWLEAIVALPDQLFFNTGIATYIWVLSNRKPPERKHKVQLINAVDLYQKMRKSLGNKRNELSADHIAQIVRTYLEFQPSETSKIFDTQDFGYRRILVERPLRLCFRVTPERIKRLREDGGFLRQTKGKDKLRSGILDALNTLPEDEEWKSRRAIEAILNPALRAESLVLPAALQNTVLACLGERDETAEPFLDEKGAQVPDPDLRDTENVPLKEDIKEYFTREVLPHVPDAWIDETKTRTGYEIPFTRHFYKYKPLRQLSEIEREFRALEDEIRAMLGEVLG